MSLKIVLHIKAIVSEIQRIRPFYTNDAEKDTIIDDDEKFQLIQLIQVLK